MESNLDERLFCKDELEIPLVTVENTAGINNLANCFVYVQNINTTFYIDRRHRIATVWAGIVEDLTYDVDANPRKLRGQILFTNKVEAGQTVDRFVYYDKQGKPHDIK